MIPPRSLWSALWLLCVLAFQVAPPPSTVGAERLDPIEPSSRIYATRDSIELRIHLFSPDRDSAGAAAPAIILFHGGGWTIGEAAWAFPRAKSLARRGIVGIAAQYRLSGGAGTTPLEAMADAREAVRWTRAHATELGIDPRRIAAYGWSAGGHLAACAALLADSSDTAGVSAVPDALVLVSPAVHLRGDLYVQRLLGVRATAESISPAERVRAGMPPTLILQGATDTVTPLRGAELFCDRMRRAGNRCELEVYPGVGHLFTPAGIPDDGWPQPDPEVQAAAARRIDAFLASIGFLR